MPNIDTILCDQHGVPVQVSDIPDDKVRKRVGKDTNGFVVVTINTDDMEQAPGPTDDTISVWQFMRDKAGSVKMADHMIVQKF